MAGKRKAATDPDVTDEGAEFGVAGVDPTVTDDVDPTLTASDPSAVTPTEPPPEDAAKVLKYNGPHVHERVIRPMDMKQVNPATKLAGEDAENWVWNRQNSFKVDVSKWTKADINGLIEAEPYFELIEG